MKQKTLFFAFFLLNCFCFAQKQFSIETGDINRFWVTFDLLSNAKSKTDSIQIIQKEYLDKGSKNLKKFAKSKNFKAEDYVSIIAKYPKYWKSLRPITQKIKDRKADIEAVFSQYQKSFPNFKTPNVCFVIGNFNSGGTTTRNTILIGAEIAAVDSTVDISEMGGNLKRILGNTGNIEAMVAHEAIHTQQSGFPLFEIFKLIKHRRLNLLNIAIVEGQADYLSMKFCGKNINENIYNIGLENECGYWREFISCFQNTPFNYGPWIYNRGKINDRPADLAYFIGYRITESYLKNQKNQARAIKKLLKVGKYKQVFRQSWYLQGCN